VTSAKLSEEKELSASSAKPAKSTNNDKDKENTPY
jgi:hypothetical protein